MTTATALRVNVPDKAARIANVAKAYRERAGLTQSDMGRTSKILTREYVSAVELGRIAIIYPDAFNEYRRLLKFPGYEWLEEMGYETDCKQEGIKPRLAALISQLSSAQQDALADMVRNMLRL